MPERTEPEAGNSFIKTEKAGTLSLPIEYLADVGLDRAKLFSNVIIKGKLTRNEIDQIYKEIDVFVMSSEQETMSLVATEAMMYGKVCILCNVAGMAKYVSHGENGLLFQTGDANDLAQE